ncbi:MAG: magnesium transporter CorA family protein [Lentisphaerae bacterium]|nr:magnesium transporter CorA family protein [Lentisphaerota bacterium]
MLTIHRWITGVGIRESGELGAGCWANLSEPTPDELTLVTQTFHLAPTFLTDPLDKDERARIEIDEDTNATLIVLRVPFHDTSLESIPYITVPLGIIIAADAVITVCARRTALTTEFTDQMRRVCPPTERHRFAFQLLLYAAIIFLRYLREISQHADQIEQNLHQALRNETLIALLDLQKSMVFFTTSLTANEMMVGRLAHMRQLGISETDLDFLDDVDIEFRQALEMATIHSNILTGMMNAYASVISNNLNRVMKFLTAITTVLMLPTLVASIYGMNIILPFQHHPHAFAITMGMAFMISLLTVLLFIRRKMF